MNAQSRSIRIRRATGIALLALALPAGAHATGPRAGATVTQQGQNSIIVGVGLDGSEPTVVACVTDVEVRAEGSTLGSQGTGPSDVGICP